MQQKIKARAAARRVQKKHEWLLRKSPAAASVIVLLMLLALAAALALSADVVFSGRELYPSPSKVIPGKMAIMEAVNYHTDQSPQDFPSPLLKNQAGKFVSSQEIGDRETGILKYISFLSSLPSQGLASYYRNYLAQESYQKIESTKGGSTQLFARRGNVSVDLYIQPDAVGSLVSIYYRIVK